MVNNSVFQVIDETAEAVKELNLQALVQKKAGRAKATKTNPSHPSTPISFLTESRHLCSGLISFGAQLCMSALRICHTLGAGLFRRSKTDSKHRRPFELVLRLSSALPLADR